MRKEFLRKVFLDIFAILLIVTISIIVYKKFYPFAFPGVEERLIIFLIILGFLLLISILEIKIKSKNEFKELRKRKYKFKEYKESKKLPLFIMRGFKNTLIQSFLWVREHPLRALIFLVYILSLYKIYQNFDIHEFSFFLLLLYIPISIKLKLDERIPVAIAIFLLILAAITLAQGFESHANILAIYVYYFLVIGVTLMFLDYFKSSKK